MEAQRTPTSDHIAVVDDDATIRELLADQLARQGFRVSAVASGRALRATLAQTPVDLIVLDVMMPGEDGLTVLKSLRQGAHSATPILLLTALGEDVDRIIGLEMGADDYVPKPFTPRELVARIRAVLRRARMLPPGQAGAQRQRFARFGDWQLDCVERLLKLLSGLAREQRDAFLLQTEGGLTLEQIAEVTGTGRETVKSRLRYALRRLRAGLEDCDE